MLSYSPHVFAAMPLSQRCIPYLPYWTWNLPGLPSPYLWFFFLHSTVNLLILCIIYTFLLLPFSLKYKFHEAKDFVFCLLALGWHSINICWMNKRMCSSASSPDIHFLNSRFIHFLSFFWCYFSKDSVWAYLFPLPHRLEKATWLSIMTRSSILFPKNQSATKTAPWRLVVMSFILDWWSVSKEFNLVKQAPKDTNSPSSRHPKWRLIWLSLVPVHSSLSCVASLQSCGTGGAAVSTGPLQVHTRRGQRLSFI